MNKSILQSKIFIRTFISWTFGLLFTFIGLISIFSEPIPGLTMFVVAAVLLPPVNTFVKDKWNFQLTPLIKTVVIIVAFFIFGSTVEPTDITTKSVVKETVPAIVEQDTTIETTPEVLIEEDQPVENTETQERNHDLIEIVSDIIVENIPTLEQEVTNLVSPIVSPDTTANEPTYIVPPIVIPDPVETLPELPSKPIEETNDSPVQVGGHIYYTSDYHSAKFYYCDTDSAWQDLSEKYLHSYPSEDALLSADPGKTLHEACK